MCMCIIFYVLFLNCIFIFARSLCVLLYKGPHEGDNVPVNIFFNVLTIYLLSLAYICLLLLANVCMVRVDY